MPYDKVEIPEKNGELLCIPSPELIPRLIRANKNKIRTYNFYIDGIHINVFIKRIREKVLRLSQQYTSALAIKIPPPLIKGGRGGLADTIILTGHQPTFYHPGILIKNLLLNRIALSENSAAINLIVDTDNLKELDVNIPSYSNGIEIKKEPFLLNSSPIPYESSPAPSWEAFRSFIKRIDEDLSNHRLKNLHENFSKFMENLDNSPFPPLLKGGEGGVSDFMTFIRRKYEEEIGSQYLEIPLSSICDTEEFIMFFMSIVKEAEGFAGIYNYRLKEYRKAHKLRYPANPFPDLSVDNKRFELPFWHFCFPPARGRVFAEYNGDELNISFENGIEINFKRGETEKAIEIIKKNKIKIRPRAITLTLFNRMFVSDVFIHGVGGAKYDRITDGIIKDFYKVEPPDFITASLTLYPSLIKGQGASLPLQIVSRGGEGQEELLEKIKKLERKARDMRYNPERYIEDKQGADNILDEKKSLLSIIEKENVNKRDISIQLKGINYMLYRKIEPAEKEIEEKIEALTKQQEEIEAIRRRDYPYFLFSPEEIIEGVAKLKTPINKGFSGIL